MSTSDLPKGMTRDISCCFTGHRLIAADRLPTVAAEVERTIRILAENGYRYFICGGALGFDTLAAQLVLKLRDELNILLILALPCFNQTNAWLKMRDGAEHIREYQRIKGLAACVHYSSDFYADGCMRDRNQFMVDHASFCVAYYDGSPKSGAGQTFRMANKAGLGIYNVYDEQISGVALLEANT